MHPAAVGWRKRQQTSALSSYLRAQQLHDWQSSHSEEVRSAFCCPRRGGEHICACLQQQLHYLLVPPVGCVHEGSERSAFGSVCQAWVCSQQRLHNIYVAVAGGEV